MERSDIRGRPRELHCRSRMSLRSIRATIECLLGETFDDHVHLGPYPSAQPRSGSDRTYFEHMFGAEIIRTLQQGQPRIDLKLGGANIFIAPVAADSDVNPPPTTPYQGLDHFGLSVSGIDAIAAELKAKGAEFTKEPTTVRPGVRVCFIRGPQGRVDRAARPQHPMRLRRSGRLLLLAARPASASPPMCRCRTGRAGGRRCD